MLSVVLDVGKALVAKRRCVEHNDRPPDFDEFIWCRIYLLEGKCSAHYAVVWFKQ